VPGVAAATGSVVAPDVVAVVSLAPGVALAVGSVVAPDVVAEEVATAAAASPTGTPATTARRRWW